MNQEALTLISEYNGDKRVKLQNFRTQLGTYLLHQKLFTVEEWVVQHDTPSQVFVSRRPGGQTRGVCCLNKFLSGHCSPAHALAEVKPTEQKTFVEIGALMQRGNF